MQKIIRLLFVLIMSTLLNASSNWSPVVLGDITMFVPYKISTQPPIVEPDNSILLSWDNEQSGVADKGTYSYYKIYAYAGERVHIDLYNQDANGNLYVKVGEKASQENYNCKSENGGETHSTENDSCSVLLDRDSFVYIAVYAPTYGCYTNVQHSVMAYIGNYGEEGAYLNKVKSVKTLEDGAVNNAIYYVEGVNHLPTVIFMSGWKSNLQSYDGFLTYVASLGYCVIAKQERGKCFTPSVYNQELTDRLNIVHNTYNADITKLGIIGHSSGGGTVHYLMNYFKGNNIAGNTKSVVMSLDGWFPFGTTEAMLNGFDTPTLLMQFGGFDGKNTNGIHPDWDDYAGQPYHHYQDPKINLAIYKSLTKANVDKEYIVLEANNNHSYFAGSYDSLISKIDFLAPIDEFLNHTIGTGAPMNLINQYDDVITNDTVSEYRYYCHISGYNFCDLDNILFQ